MRRAAGFTLLELIIAIVLVGILARFAMAKLDTPATLTLPAQMQSVADLIRRAQSLAVVRGQRMRVNVTAFPHGVSNPGDDYWRIAITCVANPPCNTDSSLTVPLRNAMFSGGSVDFNSLGQPFDSATPAAPLANNMPFTLTYGVGDGRRIHSVTVAALTGAVTVATCRLSPPSC